MNTVLIVDDFASVRFFHASLLGRAGFRPLTANDGAQALELLAREHVDLVLLDLLMPGLGGDAFVQQIRREPRHARLPVLVITSEIDHPRLAEIRRDPHCAVLTKPVRPADLLGAARRHGPAVSVPA